MKHLILAAFAISLLATPAMAQDTAGNTKVVVDLTKLDSNTRNVILDNIAASQKVPAAVAAVSNPDTINRWSQVGKGVGDAIAAAAKALNTGVNDFIKTPAGTLVVWTLLAYLFGATLWHVVGGLLFWFMVVSLILWSFKKFHVQKVVWDKARTTPTVVKYEFRSSDARTTSAIAHVVAFAVITLATIIIVF